MTELSATDIDSLRAGIAGEVLRASDPGWDEGRQAWNLVADQRPALVVIAASVEDVVATVRFAREHGLRVAPQARGMARRRSRASTARSSCAPAG
jgi:FAD/FMN-containing dehydrogenase